MRLTWEPKTTPREIRGALETLAEFYPIARAKAVGRAAARPNIVFECVETPGLCEVQRAADGGAMIRYASPAQALRGVGALLAGLAPARGALREATSFTTLGIMLDCSRNAVMTVDHLNVWLRRLALLGYNQVMLYTEDTYELPGEPYFGYQRGAYSAAELKAIDAYAARLQIEIVPCIQTLGHLEKILRHGAYRDVKDTSSVLLVGEKKTYELIDKMIGHWRKTCRRTGRIHVGMDETHDLGRGRSLDLHGHQDPFGLFNRHLAQVVRICQEHGFSPMIWSDMYFALGSKTGSYYDKESVIPKRVAAAIPREAELVYWDYYHREKEFYLEWIRRHRALGKEPLMASGIWTWNKYWYDRHTTEATAGPCIEACLEAKVQEIVFTQWGDNGAFCDHDSAFAGMAFCAEKAYGTAAPSDEALEKRFAATCGGSYATHVLASEIHGVVPGLEPALWEDPLYETRFRTWAKDDARKMAAAGKAYAGLAKRLEAGAKKDAKDRAKGHATGDLGHARNVARAFAERYDLAASVLAAYRKKDKAALRRAAARIPRAVAAVRAMADSFRTMWLAHNKPEGLETIQGRFGMVEARYREMAVRIAEFCAGQVATIAELEYRCPPE